MHSTQLTVGA